MSLTPAGTWAPNPTTVRAHSAKLSGQGDRIVYAHGRTVVIRDLKDPRTTVIYAQHAQPVTVDFAAYKGVLKVRGSPCAWRDRPTVCASA